MGALFIILPYHVVGEKGFSATRRAKNEFVAVCSYATFHRLIGNVKVQRLTRKTVNHLYAEWRQGGTVVSFRREETGRRFKECVKTFLGRKISLIARYRRPVECRAVYGVVPWHTPHYRKLAPDIVPDPAQFIGIFAPCYHIEMCPY